MESTASSTVKLRRVIIACARCKARKSRCDGITPTCGSCTERDVECVYAAVRRTRGPGKKRQPEETRFLGVDTSKPPNQNEKRGPPVVASFLLPGVFEQHLAALQNNLAARNGNRDPLLIDPKRCLTPLLPQHIATTMIMNAFAQTAAEHPLPVDQSNFLALLEEEYASTATTTSTATPNPARSALIHATLALVMHTKMAPGSESVLGGIPRASYRNATALLPALLLQEHPDRYVLTIQALLSMAIFARRTGEMGSSEMLATNAARLQKLFEKEQESQARPVELDSGGQLSLIKLVLTRLVEEQHVD